MLCHLIFLCSSHQHVVPCFDEDGVGFVTPICESGLNNLVWCTPGGFIFEVKFLSVPGWMPPLWADGWGVWLMIKGAIGAHPGNGYQMVIWLSLSAFAVVMSFGIKKFLMAS